MGALLRFLWLVLVAFLVQYLIGRLLRRIMTAGRGAGEQPRVITGHARKDPRCGIYVAEELAVRASVGGQEHYFCSTECRDRYLGR